MTTVPGSLTFTNGAPIDWNGDGIGDLFAGYHGGIAITYGLVPKQAHGAPLGVNFHPEGLLDKPPSMQILAQPENKVP
jgi:hypothetical protein